MAIAPSIIINLPGYPFDNFPSLGTIAALRAIASTNIANGDNYVVDGSATIGDGGGGVYAWNDALIATDDGVNIIKPTDTGPGSAGRWVLTGTDNFDVLRADMAASTGASLVGWKSEGAGAVYRTVAQTLYHSAIHLTDYYTGTLALNADITAALTAAVAAAFARRNAVGGIGKVIIPAGYYYQLSATITVPAFVIIEGAGKLETYLRRTGNYGDTFHFGTPNPAASVQCCGIRDLAIFHDHGNGTTPNLDPALWVNSVTGTPAHIVAYTPVACIFENLNLNNLPLQIVCQGGSFSRFSNIDTFGVWDDANAAMQEGLAGMLMAGNTAVTGSIPTWHHIDFCRFGGMTRPGVTVNYYLNSKVTTKNIGPQNSLVIQMGEAIYITNCYTGAGNSSGIVISTKSTDIIAGIFISNLFADPCGVKFQDACIKFENRDAGGMADGVTISAPQFKGQGNGWCAISDWGSTATLGSVRDLIVKGGHASVFVGNPINLNNVRRAHIDMNIAAYNIENWYGVGSDQACAAHIGASCVNVTIAGSLGGGVYGEVAAGGNNHCIDGVRADDWIASRVTVTAVNAGLSGDLFVGPPPAVTVIGSNADFTLTPKGSSRYIQHTGTLTANRVVTLSTTNAEDGDFFHVARPGGGAFNLTVNGKALTTGLWCLFVYDKPTTTWRQMSAGSL